MAAAGGTTAGTWKLAARQRYGYDASNSRRVKETVGTDPDDPPDAIALYVLPGDLERRGLVRSADGLSYEASATLGTETQYLVAGARIVWKDAATPDSSQPLDRDHRITFAAGDLLGSVSCVIDLESGELIERSTYYPNGARETQQATRNQSLQLEPLGFTGKEADEEVGLVYFGQRYLIPRIARWSTPDPLQIHALGGGEPFNSYHYVSGNLLQATDPVGLEFTESISPDGTRSYQGTYRDANGNRQTTSVCTTGNWLGAAQDEAFRAGLDHEAEQYVDQLYQLYTTIRDPVKLGKLLASTALHVSVPVLALVDLYENRERIGSMLDALASSAANPDPVQGAYDSGRAVAIVLTTLVAIVGADVVGSALGSLVEGRVPGRGFRAMLRDEGGSMPADMPRARAARDAAGRRPDGRPDRTSAAYVGIERDGEVAVGRSRPGVHAEVDADAQLPGGRMTRVMGWRRNASTHELEWRESPICEDCQRRFPAERFEPGTARDPARNPDAHDPSTRNQPPIEPDD